MRNPWCYVVYFLTLLIVAGAAVGHPGAAIAVGADGRVFFVDTGGGVFSISRDGRLLRLPGPAFHWFAFDPTSRFARAGFPRIPGAEITAAGLNPTLILSSDFPVTIGSDGAFYFPEAGSDQRVRITRMTPTGERTTRAMLPPIRRRGGLVGWVNGLAAGADGSLYYTEDAAVRKVSPRGAVTTIVAGVRVPKCASIPGEGSEIPPYLRGLDVTSDGTLFVAASGCGAVLKITPRGAATMFARTSSPWSPTAVALRGGDVFILEYLHTASDDRREWLPRIRRVSSDGTIVTLAHVRRR